MSDPTGGPPPQEPVSPPAPQAPDSWQTPPPAAPAAFQGAAVEAGPAPGVAYASLGIRIGAYIIDAIIYYVALVVVGILVFGILAFIGGTVGAFIGLVVLAVVALFGSAIYFVYTWMNLRASPGQKVLGLETVNAADGATLTRDQAIKRWAYLFGPFVLASVLQQVLGNGFLGLIVSIATFGYAIYLLYTTNKSPKRQGYHDVQAATVVVKRTK